PSTEGPPTRSRPPPSSAARPPRPASAWATPARSSRAARAPRPTRSPRSRPPASRSPRPPPRWARRWRSSWRDVTLDEESRAFLQVRLGVLSQLMFGSFVLLFIAVFAIQLDDTILACALGGITVLVAIWR